jgi:hypothetical protein
MAIRWIYSAAEYNLKVVGDDGNIRTFGVRRLNGRSIGRVQLHCNEAGPRWKVAGKMYEASEVQEAIKEWLDDNRRG